MSFPPGVVVFIVRTRTWPDRTHFAIRPGLNGCLKLLHQEAVIRVEFFLDPVFGQKDVLVPGLDCFTP